MKITAAVVPVRSAPFEIETLDLAAPLADEVLVRVVASGMCHTDLHARDGYFPNLPYPVVFRPQRSMSRLRCPALAS
jgi:aryl-alcohol dehydrogenase